MKKADYAFNKDLKRSIENLSRENNPSFYSSSNPIFIPKKKKKR